MYLFNSFHLQKKKKQTQLRTFRIFKSSVRQVCVWTCNLNGNRTLWQNSQGRILKSVFFFLSCQKRWNCLRFSHKIIDSQKRNKNEVDVSLLVCVTKHKAVVLMICYSWRTKLTDCQINSVSWHHTSLRSLPEFSSLSLKRKQRGK